MSVSAYLIVVPGVLQQCGGLRPRRPCHVAQHVGPQDAGPTHGPQARGEERSRLCVDGVQVVGPREQGGGGGVGRAGEEGQTPLPAIGLWSREEGGVSRKEEEGGGGARRLESSEGGKLGVDAAK